MLVKDSLRRCPLCGGRAKFVLKSEVQELDFGDRDMTKVACGSCYLTALGLWFETEEAAAAAWNEAVDEMIERK